MEDMIFVLMVLGMVLGGAREAPNPLSYISKPKIIVMFVLFGSGDRVCSLDENGLYRHICLNT